MSYWDTSALAKLYTEEADSADFEAKAAELNATLTTARVTVWEFRRVALRKETAGAIQANGAETVWQELEADIASGWLGIVEPTAQLAEEFDRVMSTCYRHTPPMPVRTMDALHLAAARVAGETEMVATDKKLREAAALLGFKLFPI
ncbi:MAG: type II toxin-antitoxin system VapC family toxin [Verrucomicrobia bacterium]|nr:type II toxin-antitoxin system VapC family toxin [Verrucomicrobiota bacterium]